MTTLGRSPWVGLFATVLAVVLPVGADPAVGPLFPVHKDGKWGYIDRTGRIVVEPKFDNAERFSEGFAAVVADGRHGYIDKTGAMRRGPGGDRRGAVGPREKPGGAVHRPFRDGLAAVHAEGGIGFLDRTGKLIIPARFSSAED